MGLQKQDGTPSLSVLVGSLNLEYVTDKHINAPPPPKKMNVVTLAVQFCLHNFFSFSEQSISHCRPYGISLLHIQRMNSPEGTGCCNGCISLDALNLMFYLDRVQMEDFEHWT